MTLKKVLASGLIAAIAVAGAASTASAHGKHKGIHKNHSRTVIILGGGGHHKGSCDYYYWKWQKTGYASWKAAYYECLGVW